MILLFHGEGGREGGREERGRGICLFTGIAQCTWTGSIPPLVGHWHRSAEMISAVLSALVCAPTYMYIQYIHVFK